MLSQSMLDEIAYAISDLAVVIERLNTPGPDLVMSREKALEQFRRLHLALAMLMSSAGMPVGQVDIPKHFGISVDKVVVLHASHHLDASMLRSADRVQRPAMIAHQVQANIARIARELASSLELFEYRTRYDKGTNVTTLTMSLRVGVPRVSTLSEIEKIAGGLDFGKTPAWPFYADPPV